MSGVFRDFVLADLKAMMDDGDRAVLATLVHIEGSGPRPAGSQMAIRVRETSDGFQAVGWCGFLSGGCVEDALAAEAARHVASHRPVFVDYGEGSKVWDIRLPCGSRIHVCLDPTLQTAPLNAILQARAARKPVRLVTDLSKAASDSPHGVEEISDAHELLASDRSAKSLVTAGRVDPSALVPSGTITSFARRYLPPVRLVLVGTGPVAESLAGLGQSVGFEMVVLAGHGEWRGPTAGVQVLVGEESARVAELDLDPWSALITLFHEHERELAPLARALTSRAFYLGALGSKRVHDLRRQALMNAGHSRAEVNRIDGPAGLKIGAANPPEIALAILARVVEAYRNPA